MMKTSISISIFLLFLLPIISYSQSYTVWIYECKGENIAKNIGGHVNKFSTNNLVHYEIDEMDSILTIKSFTRNGRFKDEFRILQKKKTNGKKIYELSANVKPYKGNYGVEILSEQIVFTALLKNNTTIVTTSPIIKKKQL